MLPNDFTDDISKRKLNFFWQKIFILWSPKTKYVSINPKIQRINTLPKNKSRVKLHICPGTLLYKYRKITKFNTYPIFNRVLIFKLWGYKLKMSTFILIVRLMTNTKVYISNRYRQKKSLTEGVNFSRILTLL